MEDSKRTHEVMRQRAQEARNEAKEKTMARRRFTTEDALDQETFSFEVILTHCKNTKFCDVIWLERLKTLLASGEVNPDDFFKGNDGSLQLHSLANVISGGHGESASSQILAVHCAANLGPLTEKYGLQMARSIGPYLVTLLSSSSTALVEASAVSLGNLALSGYRVAKVFVNQGCIKSLCQNLTSASMYGLYHILHAHIAEEYFAIDEIDEVNEECIKMLKKSSLQKAPIELFWLLFLLSCDPNQHEKLAEESIINCCLDTCTYEIFQKSDPRPLVKVVTPLVRMLANLCASPATSEKVCLTIINHPDLTAILMALLGTNYTHLVRETLWWFSNMINSESVVVQEQFVELNIMDRLEFHTIQAVQKIDPYAPIISH